MKRIWNLALMLGSLAVFGYGANWNAKLLDATCAASNKTSQQPASEKFAQTCAPTSTTTTYAIEANGKIMTLDEHGNQMAAAALKDGSVKPDKDGDVHVTVRGTAQGNMITVDAVTAAKGD